MKRQKQAIVIRADLKMNKGKLVAQGSHAALGGVLNTGFKCTMSTSGERGLWIPFHDNPELEHWLTDEFTKVVLRCDSESELLELYNKAKGAMLHTTLITDAGHTVFNGIPTNTCISIGPDNIDEIDAITGHLKLL